MCKLSLIILVSANVYLEDKTNNYYLKKINFIFTIILLSIPFAFRECFFQENLGTDYSAYKVWFNTVCFREITFKYFYDIGFNLLISASKFFYNDFHFFLFNCAFIYNFLMLKFIKRNSLNYVFSIILYICFIYFSSYNVLRQCLAGSIFLYGTKYIFKKNKIKYFFSILIATSFHTTAFTLILLYPYLNNKIFYRIKNYFVLSISLLSYFYFQKIIDFLFKITMFLSKSYYNRYINMPRDFEVGNYVYFILFSCIFALFFIMDYKKILKKFYKYYYEMLVLTMSLLLLSTRHMIFLRMSIYLIPFITIFFSITTNLFKNKLIKNLYIIFIICLSIYSLIF